MERKKKLSASFVVFTVAFASLIVFISVLIAASEESNICDVPGTHSSIQMAVDDSNCLVVNLVNPIYQENVLITRSITIQGQHITSTTVDGGHVGGVFTAIASGINVTITQLTIRNGSAPNGGGIYFQGETLFLDQVNILGNQSLEAWPDGAGGGLYLDDESIVTIRNSAVNGNSASTAGGIFSRAARLDLLESELSGNSAIFSVGGLLIARGGDGAIANIISSTISSNTAGISGGIETGRNTTTTILSSVIISNTSSSVSGGVGCYSGAYLKIVNSTISNNSATSGGGMYSPGTTEIDFSTLNSNAAADGSNIFVHEIGTLAIRNSIVTNAIEGADCSGTITSLGHNIDSDGSCQLTATGDLPNTDPYLGPLQDNGGPTWTHALRPGSKAIDAGDDVDCPGIDQRGVPRPQLQSCDVGAFEYDGLRLLMLPTILKPVSLETQHDPSRLIGE